MFALFFLSSTIGINYKTLILLRSISPIIPSMWPVVLRFLTHIEMKITMLKVKRVPTVGNNVAIIPLT